MKIYEWQRNWGKRVWTRGKPVSLQLHTMYMGALQHFGSACICGQLRELFHRTLDTRAIHSSLWSEPVLQVYMFLSSLLLKNS